MLVVGPVCKKIPDCPKSVSYSFAIAFPQWITRGSTGANLLSPVFFFLCPNGTAMG
ncbi:hypothetical protein ACF0H5_002984 [Mactra antiquata]